MKSVPWLALLLVGLGCWWIGNLDGRQHVEDAGLDQQYAASVRVARAWYARYELARSDSVDREAEITRLSHRETLAKVEADSFGKERDNLRATLPALIGEDTAWVRLARLDSMEIMKLREGLKAVSRERDVWRMEAVKWKALGDQAAGAILDMQRTLEAEDQARQCRVLWVACPSRKSVAVVALLAGVVAGVELGRR